MSKILTLNPVFDNIVVQQLKAKETTDSGFFIPDVSQKKPNISKVISIGPDCKSGVKVGDYIVLPKSIQVTTDIEINGEIFSVVKEENIIAMVNINEE